MYNHNNINKHQFIIIVMITIVIMILTMITMIVINSQTMDIKEINGLCKKHWILILNVSFRCYGMPFPSMCIYSSEHDIN